MHELTIAEAAELIRTRKLSPVDLTQALLDRIEQYDSHVNAFIHVTRDKALAQARAAETEIAAGRLRGPLHGVPFALKDIYDAAGVPTTAHSRVCAGNGPAAADAASVARLHAAGAVLLGKLATHEFATSGPMFDLPYPPARNPWHLDHITGGSSSGSAAAVAAGMVPGALGSDTGGSIRIPAGLCGIAGLKPTYGRISCRGVLPNSWTLDTCGPMARTSEDCAILLQAIAGHDPADPTCSNEPVPDYRAGFRQTLRGMRIGVVRHFWEEDMLPNAEIASSMEAALDVFRELGAELETVRLRPLRDYFAVRIILSESELLAAHQEALGSRPQDYGSEFLTRTAACVYQAVDFIRAQRERGRMLAEMEPVYRRYDVLITPGSGAAPRVDTPHAGRAWLEANSYVYTPFNVTGGPALVVCGGFSAQNLPLGLQIAGRPFDEATVLRVGHAYERAAGWLSRRPPLDGARPTLWPDLSPVADNTLDPATLAHVDALARRAGLQADPRTTAGLYSAVGPAFDLARHLPRDHRFDEGPASVFRLAPIDRR
jgi:aspartyl-tRNA(Asn)/glutamyl-tRNA(Gln) amidotransferase subunit A